jgi:hypothetical protein
MEVHAGAVASKSMTPLLHESTTVIRECDVVSLSIEECLP